MGGSHISALKLIEALDATEFRPLIVLHSDAGQFGDFLRSEGISFELAPTPVHISPVPAGRRQGLVDTARMLAALTRYLRERKVRIVHSNEGPMHATWGVPAKLAGAKLLWHHRSSPYARGLRHLAPWLADHVISVSEFAAPRPGLISAARKCSVVHSPFDTENCVADRVTCRAAAIAELNLSPETRMLGFFGNLVDRKRPLLFVDALAALSRREPDLPVAGLIFGSPLEPGLDVAVLERARQLGIADRIHLMGFRHPSTPWMAACDALVVTAVDEPFGRTLIEAMLLRTPVVAARSGGNIEAIRHGETGLLVPPDDADAFACVTLQLLKNSAMANAIAETAHCDALSRFGIRRHRNSITEIYRRLLAGAT